MHCMSSCKACKTFVKFVNECKTQMFYVLPNNFLLDVENANRKKWEEKNKSCICGLFTRERRDVVSATVELLSFFHL